jgi:hypothetical protein
MNLHSLVLTIQEIVMQSVKMKKAYEKIQNNPRFLLGKFARL